MRRVILKEDVAQGLTDPTLKKLYSVCYESFKNYKPSTMNNVEVLRKDVPGQGYIVITNDLKYQTYKEDNSKSKSGTVQPCPAFKGIEQVPLGDDMEKAIQQLKTKDKSLKSIDDVGVREGLISKTYIPVDLNTLDKLIFPEPNKYFLYRQKGIGGVQQNIPEQVKTWLEGKGWSFDEPDNLELRKTRQPLVDALKTIPGGQELKPRLQGEMGIDINKTYVYKKAAATIGGIKSFEKFKNLATSLEGKDVERQTCRTAVKALITMSELYRKNKSIIQYIDSADTDKVTEYVYQCDFKKFLSGGLGVGDELNKLKRDSSPFGLLNKVNTAQNQANMNESIDNYLKSVLRKKLTVLSESKKKSVITTKEFKNYIRTIDEAFESLNPGKKRINEDGLKDMLSGALGYGGEGIISYFKEKLAKSIIDKFVPGGSKTWLGGVISTSIGNIKMGDYLNGNILKCEFLVPELAKGIGENAIKQFADKKGLTGGFYDVLRNSVIEVVDDVPFVDSIQNGLSTVLCPTLGKLKGALGGLFGSLGTELKQEFTPSK